MWKIKNERSAVTIKENDITNKRIIFDECLITTDINKPFNACVKIINHVYSEKP